MILNNSLYNIVSHTQSQMSSQWEIALNPEHFIYKAHFPGEPITPGVCILQICIELLSQHVGRPLTLSCAKNVKYLKVIVPDRTPVLTVTLQKVQVMEPQSEGEPALVKVQAVVGDSEEIYTKLSLECR